MRDNSEDRAAQQAEPGGYPATIAAGYQQTAGKAQPDPMWMPIQRLIAEWHQLQRENEALRIEVSSHKLRAASLEHERNLSQAGR